MLPHILLTNNQSKVKTGHLKIKKVALQLLERLRCHNKELSILFVDDDEIQCLNKRYRKKDKQTDVLSFPQLSPQSTYPEIVYRGKKPPLPMGDIVISLETAKKQAKEKRHSLKKECYLLLIHGLLHLIGYNHEGVSKSKAIEMKKKEEELIAWLIPSSSRRGKSRMKKVE